MRASYHAHGNECGDCAGYGESHDDDVHWLGTVGVARDTGDVQPNLNPMQKGNSDWAGNRPGSLWLADRRR